MEILKDIFRSYWQFVVIVILCILLFNKCQDENIVKNDTPIYSTVTNKEEAVKIVTIPDTILKKFYDIKTITKTVVQTKFDTIKIVYKDSIPCIFERSGEVKTNEYTFNYKIDNHSANVLNLKVTPDTLIIVDGSKRKWFLGKETNAVDISHSNKLFYNSDIQHVEVVKKKYWYDTTVAKVGFGIIIGKFALK